MKIPGMFWARFEPHFLYIKKRSKKLPIEQKTSLRASQRRIGGDELLTCLTTVSSKIVGDRSPNCEGERFVASDFLDRFVSHNHL